MGALISEWIVVTKTARSHPSALEATVLHPVLLRLEEVKATEDVTQVLIPLHVALSFVVGRHLVIRPSLRHRAFHAVRIGSLGRVFSEQRNNQTLIHLGGILVLINLHGHR